MIVIDLQRRMTGKLQATKRHHTAFTEFEEISSIGIVYEKPVTTGNCQVFCLQKRFRLPDSVRSDKGRRSRPCTNGHVLSSIVSIT
jgi:hypothetical protein